MLQVEVPRDSVGSEHCNEWDEVEPYSNEEESHDPVDGEKDFVQARSFREDDFHVGWQYNRVLLVLV